MANVRRRKPVGMLGDAELGGDLPVGAEAGAVGLPAEDPAELGGLGAPSIDLGAMGTDAIPTDGLAMLGAGVEAEPEMGLEGEGGDEEIAALEAALQDPSIPPDQKAAIQQMLEEAARRSLAGVGGI